MNDKTHCTNKTDEPRRISFLLRLWACDETDSHWHASLEMPGTGKRVGFASLEQLFMYLIDLIENRTTHPENRIREENHKEI